MPKHAYHDPDLWLDLTHITTRIIVAAGPSDEFVTTLFRAPIDQVVDYLNMSYTYGKAIYWHIWNFRGEGPGYDAAKLQNQLTYRPFPDHQPPTIELMYRITREISDFLSLSKHNIALLHCKEGKGRSGTICCAYLMYEAKQKGILLGVDEAISVFTKKRMRKHFGNGVSILCQIKYLNYWKTFLQLSPDMRSNFESYNLPISPPFEEKHSSITKIIIIRPTLLLILSKIKLSTYVEHVAGVVEDQFFSESLHLSFYNEVDRCYELTTNLPIQSHMKDLKIEFDRGGCLAYTWFNMYFESIGEVLRPLPTTNQAIESKYSVSWEDFDGYRGTKYKGVYRLFDKMEIQWAYRSE